MKPHEKKKRIDLADGPLSATPFAGLRRLGSNTAGAPVSSPVPQPAAPAPKHGPQYKVLKSKKGNWPIAVERRAGGKMVTIVRNVQGDGQALLAALRKHCGAGGAVREEAVEIQGDQSEKVIQFLEGQ